MSLFCYICFEFQYCIIPACVATVNTISILLSRDSNKKKYFTRQRLVDCYKRQQDKLMESRYFINRVATIDCEQNNYI